MTAKDTNKQAGRRTFIKGTAAAAAHWTGEQLRSRDVPNHIFAFLPVTKEGVLVMKEKDLPSEPA